MPHKPRARAVTDEKLKALEPARETSAGETLTTNHGTRINDNQNSLKAGARGPSLLEDFVLREKITHFGEDPMEGDQPRRPGRRRSVSGERPGGPRRSGGVSAGPGEMERQLVRRWVAPSLAGPALRGAVGGKPGGYSSTF